MLTLIRNVPPSCPLAQPVVPISHQPKQNHADGGTAQIKVNPTQVYEQMGHPVVVLCDLSSPLELWPKVMIDFKIDFEFIYYMQYSP